MNVPHVYANEEYMLTDRRYASYGGSDPTWLRRAAAARERLANYVIKGQEPEPVPHERLAMAARIEVRNMQSKVVAGEITGEAAELWAMANELCTWSWLRDHIHSGVRTESEAVEWLHAEARQTRFGF